jgi:sulfide:quinone oxidoreductase
MQTIKYITPRFAVTGALRPGDFAELAALGFRTIVSNLPDGENSAYLTSGEEAEFADRVGLAFRHIPATKFDILSDSVVGAMAEALSELDGPVLAHCASGLRSAVAFAAAAARLQPIDCVLAAVKKAGFDLAAVRDDLGDQEGHAASGVIPATLDCGCG